jgi:hypothetical protein
MFWAINVTDTILNKLLRKQTKWWIKIRVRREKNIVSTRHKNNAYTLCWNSYAVNIQSDDITN